MTGRRRVRRDAPVAAWERVHGELPGTPGEYDRRMRARREVRSAQRCSKYLNLKIID
eukprot:SAG31_NODE_705_length_12695_cov_3.147007_9_plen_57_part_00